LSSGAAAPAELTKQELEASPELDKKREYIVREIFSTEQTYVKNLEVALSVRPPSFLPGAMLGFILSSVRRTTSQ